MPIDRLAAERIAQSGVEALERGDAGSAQASFAQLVDGGFATAPMQLMLARACRASGDHARETLALDAVLKKDPGNVRALLMRGDAGRRGGDVRGAVSFYNAALAAARTGSNLPPDVVGDLRQAERFVAESAAAFAASLERAVDQAGASGASAERLRHTVEIATGRREIHLQQPSVLYVPYLPQRQFYEREEFEWAAPLEARTAEIKQELLALLDQGAAFEPYIQAEENRPQRDFHGMLDDPSWSALYLWKDGELVEENAARCPIAVEALRSVPMSRVGQRTPSVLFSMLRPGAHIPPHHGMLNCRLICHLPLIVPDGCWLRVGNETRSWQEGKLLIFDDSIQHEAKNDSGELRVILLFDIWRPELSEAEQRGVSAMFEAIDRQGGVPDDH